MRGSFFITHIVFLVVEGLIEQNSDKQGGMMAGGWSTHDLSSDEVKKLADELKVIAMNHVNAQRNSPFLLVPGEVLSLKSQVVQGSNYDVEFLAFESTCSKSGVDLNGFSYEKCPVGNGAEQKKMLVRIWSRPWLSSEESHKVTQISESRVL